MEKLPATRPNWREWRPALRSMAESGLPLKDCVEMFSRAYVDVALEISRGNQVRAAQIIQTHRNTIGRWAKRK